MTDLAQLFIVIPGEWHSFCANDSLELCRLPMDFLSEDTHTQKKRHGPCAGRYLLEPEVKIAELQHEIGSWIG
ncbi:hypothetical protein OUZ56_013857 [Daphnia magna]|uniref:Uncharacterized protein n=1 Tax=Daphnia magna TaxID=35525 RepID=A0ABQ9Z7U7_9CRUS|nr:hypothetical protein OUZ56_013857 [Daphnia magna]